MKTITYIPSKDELMLKFRPTEKRPTREIKSFKLWWDEEGNIRALIISPFTEELKEFKKKRGWIQLGGIWKGVKIDEKDIREARRELLKKLKERWEKW